MMLTSLGTYDKPAGKFPVARGPVRDRCHEARFGELVPCQLCLHMCFIFRSYAFNGRAKRDRAGCSNIVPVLAITMYVYISYFIVEMKNRTGEIEINGTNNDSSN